MEPCRKRWMDQIRSPQLQQALSYLQEALQVFNTDQAGSNSCVSLLYFCFCCCALDLCQWGSDVSFNFQISKIPAMTFHVFSEQACYESDLKNGKLQNFAEARKKLLWGQHRHQENSGGCLVRSGEIPRPRQTSINKTNAAVMDSEQSALVWGSDPP